MEMKLFQVREQAKVNAAKVRRAVQEEKAKQLAKLAGQLTVSKRRFIGLLLNSRHEAHISFAAVLSFFIDIPAVL